MWLNPTSKIQSCSTIQVSGPAHTRRVNCTLTCQELPCCKRSSKICSVDRIVIFKAILMKLAKDKPSSRSQSSVTNIGTTCPPLGTPHCSHWGEILKLKPAWEINLPSYSFSTCICPPLSPCPHAQLLGQCCWNCLQAILRTGKPHAPSLSFVVFGATIKNKN